MNNTIETILAHRSIRKFTAVPITDEQRQTIIQAGLAASSSSMLQVVSIVRVTDSEKRKQLAQCQSPIEMSSFLPIRNVRFGEKRNSVNVSDWR